MSDEDRNKALLRRFYEEFWSQGELEAIRAGRRRLRRPPSSPGCAAGARRTGRANHHVADHFSRHV
jgi:hypothetical protein